MSKDTRILQTGINEFHFQVDNGHYGDIEKGWGIGIAMPSSWIPVWETLSTHSTITEAKEMKRQYMMNNGGIIVG